MKGLRERLLYKALLTLLLAAFAFCAVFCGGAVLLLLDGGYVGGGVTWESTRAARLLLYEYEDMTVEYLRAREEDTSAYTYYQQQSHEARLAELAGRLDAEGTGFRCALRDETGAALYTNAPGRPQDWTVLRYNFLYRDANGLEPYYGHSVLASAVASSDPLLADRSAAPSLALPVEAAFTLELGLADELPAGDAFLQMREQFDRSQAAFPLLAAGAVAGTLGFFAALLLLLRAAGHTRRCPGITVGWFDRLWLDVLAVAWVLLWSGGLGLALELISSLESMLLSAAESHFSVLRSELLLTSGCAALLALLALPLLYTIAVRGKNHALLRSTLCWLLWRGVVRLGRGLLGLLRAMRLSWRLTLGFAGYELLSLLLACLFWRSAALAAALFVVNLLLAGGLCLWAEAFHRVREGGRALAAGDLSYRLDTARLPRDLKAHAEDLNSISRGMAAAVEKQLQSERFRSELITNVSHDLKTPLTSIINYVDLLKKEELHNPKAEEYVQVLDRKSQRLKKLTEDLVEASKASTGALAVSRERLGLGQLVTQAAGEYQERLAAAQLRPVLSLPEEEAYVTADGRHLWRILDNLLSNCCKYALPGTRVYVDVARQEEGRVLLSVKNVSREALNLPPEQLLERFVRGDEARSTEGSGLGLSIARSLAELQGGDFRLSIDGDLFKASLSLPEAK